MSSRGSGLTNLPVNNHLDFADFTPPQDIPQGYSNGCNEEFPEEDCPPSNTQVDLQERIMIQEDNLSEDSPGDESKGGYEYQVTPNEQLPRLKRYPEHLDPTKVFFPFWLRVGECPLSSDGQRQHFCPTPTTTGKWVCIDDYQLCDGMKNCPNAEDESSTYCMFFKSLKSEVELLTRTVSALSTATVLPPSAEESLQQEKYPITATIRKYGNVKFPWQSGSN